MRLAGNERVSSSEQLSQTSLHSEQQTGAGIHRSRDGAGRLGARNQI